MKKGIGASKGYAIGYAFIKKDEEVKIEERIVENIDEELARLKAATDATRAQLEKIKDKAEKEMGAEKAAVFESHMMLLDDPEFTGAIEMNVSNNKVNAEKALNDVLDMYVAIFGSMEDEYMKERIADVKDVGARILKNLAGVDTEGLASVGENTIVIAHDLTPSDTSIKFVIIASINNAITVIENALKTPLKQFPYPTFTSKKNTPLFHTH